MANNVLIWDAKLYPIQPHVDFQFKSLCQSYDILDNNVMSFWKTIMYSFKCQGTYILYQTDV